ncbi:unnamed protein product [Cylindrotheca closterium]|uniref:Exostosin GT47 domain-containing protein n=1 Tax=Cylindrotheca closterium TaxID=2856 RepID=A0AAD2FHX7_9STRA|nr:unnamed protein product [Cylindrotheca closterium]
MDESLYLPNEEHEEQKPISRRQRLHQEEQNDDNKKRRTLPRGNTSALLQMTVFSVGCMVITQKTLFWSASQSSRGLSSSLEEQAFTLPKMQSDSSQEHATESPLEISQKSKHMKLVNHLKKIHTQSIESNIQESAERHDVPNLIVENKKKKTDHYPTPPTTTTIVDERDSDCIFRNSPLYRSVYVYPSPLDKEWEGEILSEYASRTADGRNVSWPWLEMDQRLKEEGKAQYDANNKDFNQYTTELLVRDIITHPNSCLRTDDPESASLFYIPYLPTMEYHNGSLFGDYKTSPFSQAMLDATSLYVNDSDSHYNKYDLWEKTFGLTSKYWKRRNGADHIVVMSEPLHGFSHPRNRRGNYHYLHSQKQLSPPIVISIELSTTFVEMYPNCARKNILMPYPNIDGKWFNGAYNQQTKELWGNLQVPNISESLAALKAERAMANSSKATTNTNTTHIDELLSQPRPLAQFYGAGNHGSCRQLRQRLGMNYRCTESGKLANRFSRQIKYQHGYRQSTFCPCPGGDSPSAKRHFDALHAGCIPVILSHDFVWPFTSEFDKNAWSILDDDSEDGMMRKRRRNMYRDGRRASSMAASTSPLSASDFALRLNASEFEGPKYGYQCQVWNNTSNSSKISKDLQSYLETISSSEIERLRAGALQASELYSYYRRRPDLPENPLREGILPDGGAAHQLIRMLSRRANGNLWPACQKEQQAESSSSPSIDKISTFQC